MGRWQFSLGQSRDWTLRGLILLAGVGLAYRAFYLQVIETPFLQDMAANRQVRTLDVHANRGMIRSRNGEPLAVSTAVDALWVDPRLFVTEREHWPKLARLLDMPAAELEQLIGSRLERRFVYLKRRLTPQLAAQADDLGLKGLYLQREYRRYYPTAEVSGHLLGFTNIDDQGQEGIELKFNQLLSGQAGRTRVVQDLHRRWVQPVEAISTAVPGTDLQLTLDRRLQYLAYQELKAAVHQHRAESGSAVVIDIATGDLLAMVNQPSFNPNETAGRRPAHFRNRAVTDVFEPGSTIKPFIVAAALQAGTYRTTSWIDTDPGYLVVGGHKIRDHRPFGPLTLEGILQKSSNVGAVRIAMGLDPQQIEALLRGVGVGSVSGAGLPGESTGLLAPAQNWRKVDQATLSFGYGLSVTALQLARAYAILGNHGRDLTIQIIPAESALVMAQAISPQVADQVVKMMEAVIEPEGTGSRAAVAGYRIAGKTGTAHLFRNGSYDKTRYVATFAGLAPASAPRLAMVVTIKDPKGEAFYAGDVAAPVFSRFMHRALPLLKIPADGALTPSYLVDASGVAA